MQARKSVNESGEGERNWRVFLARPNFQTIVQVVVVKTCTVVVKRPKRPVQTSEPPIVRRVLGTNKV